ncbi:MAG TPA: transporter substrate-binding domain-containing protein [Holophaga sp.]|nr:transporter substrate-binding domain-containing protein [Holophaga sp.]
MRRICKCLLAFMSVAGVPALHAQVPLNVEFAATEYAPFIGQKLAHGGLLTRIVQEAYRHENVAVHLAWVPNKRAIACTMNGSYDGTFGWTCTPERQARLLYSRNALYTFRMVFFQRKGASYPWKRLEDLEPFQIGVTAGNFVSDDFSRLKDAGRLRIKEAWSDSSNMKNLVLNRIDLFPMEQEAGWFLADATLSKGERGQVVDQDKPICEVPVYVVVRRSHPLAQELIDRFDKGYRELARTGRLKLLIEQAPQVAKMPHATPSAQP